MTTILTQSTDSALPDRPRGGGVGLRVTFDTGNGGAYLTHDLGAAVDPLHVRLMLNTGDAEGGSVRIAGGHDSAGDPTWWLDLDADARRLTLHLSGGDTLEATLNALPWHAVEVRLDAAGGTLAWWIDGREAGTLSGTFASLATRHVWIGGVLKHSNLVGSIHLDGWAMDDAFIGPVVARPVSDHADDPARWLVIYNADDADSVAWVEYYRAARGVPFANLLGLPLPGEEVISDAQYAQLNADVDDYLARTGLAAQVMGILLGYRVPGYADFGIAGGIDAVPSLMHRSDPSAGYVANANGSNALPVRPTFTDPAGDRLTARIDAPDLAGAIALVDRATALLHEADAQHGGDSGTGSDEDGDHGDALTLWFDPFAGGGGLFDSHINQMVAWALSLDRMRMRVPMVFSGDPDQRDASASFSEIRHDGWFWGWAEASPPAGLFADPAGRRVCSLPLEPRDATATTLRSATPGNWIDTPMAAGYAAAVATARVYSTSAVPYARPFFEAQRRGWTLAEAWYLALPLLREGLYLVGDPLLRVALPRAGWDVFGPLDRLEAIDPATPAQALRRAETMLSLPEALRPAPGEAAHYLVRHIDRRGRSEAGATAVHIVRDPVTGEARPPALMPAWPDAPHWPTPIEDGRVVVRAQWERSLALAHVAAIELRGEVDGAAETTLAIGTFDPRDRVVEVRAALPMTSARYRWRIAALTGVIQHTPWSATLRPHSTTDTLTALEIAP